jgi:ribosomal-protein-serine acetyltransferase
VVIIQDRPKYQLCGEMIPTRINLSTTFMFSSPINESTELRLVDRQHTEEVFKVINANRDHIRKWHPWVDLIQSAGAVERAISNWLQQHANNRGFFAGIWHQGQFCGVINHLNVDWVNRWTAFGYWLDAGHQGRGIMTASCRAMIDHSFKVWKLNRITIECASENAPSRAIPERLGFKLEGITRQVEWIHDHYVDHAIYGLLRSEYVERDSQLDQSSKRSSGVVESKA